MTQDLLASMVGILSDKGSKKGSGFLIGGEGLIATCSHVVQSKIDQKPNKPCPEHVNVIFHQSGEMRRARVEQQWWRPCDGEDVAILRIEGELPEKTGVLPLGSSNNTGGHEFETFGYPQDYPGGLWDNGRIGNPVQDKAGKDLVQLRDAKNVIRGFSGAPIWDKSKNSVVGMVNAYASPKQGRHEETAFAIPSETLAAVCTDLEILHGLDIFYESTLRNLSAVPDKIGPYISIPRQEEIRILDEVCQEHDLTLLIGPPGCGKTVVAKMWLQQKVKYCTAIWWNASRLDTDDFSSFEQNLHLPDSLLQVLSHKSSDTRYLVVDGLDRQYKPQVFQNLSTVLRSLGLGKDGPWRIVITSRDDDVERLQAELIGSGVDSAKMRPMAIREPSLNNLRVVWTTYPALERLVSQGHLHRLLLKPRILDLFARRLAAGRSVDTSQWVGESDLIEWFWTGEVRSGNARAERDRFLKLLAEKQADGLTSEIPADKFSVSDLRPVDLLINDGIVKETDGRYAFHHDSCGDWSRQRILLGHGSKLPHFLENKLLSPLWHQATRLLGLHLLEQRSLLDWEETYEALGTLGTGARLGQDLISEAVIFAANPGRLLDKMWDRLAADNGFLLSRLLKRFLHVATFPNIIVLEVGLLIYLESRTQASTVERIPYKLYWPPVIQFLHSHKSQAMFLAPELVAEVCEKWLHYAATKDLAFDQAADMALDLAEDRLALHMVYWRGHRDEIDPLVFKAAIAACKADLERSINLARTACGRQDPTGRVLELIVKYETEARSMGKIEHLRSEPSSAVLAREYDDAGAALDSETLSPWPDGPLRRGDRSFADACFKSDALHPLILNDPVTAKEIILAALIKSPEERAYFALRHGGPSKLGLTMQDDSFYPPMHFQGPFAFFLQNRFDEGLDLIIRLVDFVTARWTAVDEEDSGITVDLPSGTKWFVGDQQVFHWYRDIALAPHAVVSALMALENWFYIQSEKSDTTASAIHTILESSNSVALLGLLCGVGKKRPILFTESLQPLLSVPEFYFWDQFHLGQGEQLQMLPWGGLGRPVWMGKLAHQWHNLEHRKYRLMDVALQLLVTSEETRQFFDRVRTKWRERIDSGKEGSWGEGFMRRLVGLFDPANFRQWTGPDGNTFTFSHPPSEPNEGQREIISQIQHRKALLALPHRLWQALTGKEPLMENEIDSLWHQIQDIANLEPIAGHDWDMFGPNHCLTGLAAVLIKHHRDWLRRYPDREDWCIRVITEQILNPPVSPPFDHEINHVDTRWQGFCASAIPILWSENPSSPVLRRCVALLATDSHYDAIRILFEAASQCRNRLGKDFTRLRHLSMRWAVARWTTLIAERLDKQASPLAEWREKETRRFELGLIQAQVPRWDEIAFTVKGELPADLPRGSSYETESEGNAYLDLYVVTAANSWLPSLDEAIDEAERVEWLLFWREALCYSLNLIQECLGDYRTSDAGNYEWYHWLFDRLALVIRTSTPEENPESLWRPILELGPDGHYWIEAFLGSWFIWNLQIEPFPEAFVCQWKKMTEFAFVSPQWDFSTANQTYDLETMWCNVLGFGGYWVEMWDESHRDLIREMEPVYESWAETHLMRPRCATLFAKFLKRPAAAGLVLRGLTWLETAVREAGEYYFGDKETVNQISSLLDHCWNSRRTELRNNTNAFTAFRHLLIKLAELQDSVANEILMQIAGYGGSDPRGS